MRNEKREKRKEKRIKNQETRIKRQESRYKNQDLPTGRQGQELETGGGDMRFGFR
jgi:hypothetical protein